MNIKRLKELAGIVTETKKLTAADYIAEIGDVLNSLEAAFGGEELYKNAEKDVKKLISKAKKGVGAEALKSSFEEEFKTSQWNKEDKKWLRKILNQELS